MGFIELYDGVTNRRIPVPELDGVLRIEITSDRARIVVPESVEVVQEEADP